MRMQLISLFEIQPPAESERLYVKYKAQMYANILSGL